MTIKKYFATALMTCLMAGFVSGNSYAKDAEDTNTGAYLRATLKNAPALQPVEWKVYRSTDNTLVKSATTHSLVLPLDPGNYKAIVKLNNVTRDRSFTVMNNSKVDVTIALD